MLFDLFSRKKREKKADASAISLSALLEAPQHTLLPFFEAPENKKLFANCPCRKHLARLHTLDAGTARRIVLHMLGHVIELKAGQPCLNEKKETISAIDQHGIDDEIRYVYNDLNNPALGEARSIKPDADQADDPEYRGFGPEQRGCFGADARAELMAEAFRAYMQNPNYLKTVAPNVAHRIRAAVNPNPKINTIIQFN